MDSMAAATGLKHTKVLKARRPIEIRTPNPVSRKGTTRGA